MNQHSEQLRHAIRWGCFSLGVLTCFTLLPWTALMQQRSTSSPMRLVPVFQQAQVKPVMPMQVAQYKDEYFVVDYKTSRILVYDRHMNFKRTIGSVGAGPGELFHPDDIVISLNGYIYVDDSGNNRIHVLTTDGRFVSQFACTSFRGFGVTSKGEVLLGQPERGKLISAFSRNGKPLRAFGELRKFSDIYGQQYVSKDDKYKRAINRVALFVDQGDNVYVTFLLAPILQKYDGSGRLLYESRLKGRSIDVLTEMLLTETPNKVISQGMDGIEARLVTWWVTIDAAGGNILVLLPDNSIYVFNKDGKKQAELIPTLPENRGIYSYHISSTGPSRQFINKLVDGDGWYFFRVAALGEKDVFLTSIIPPGVFRLRLPGEYK